MSDYDAIKAGVIEAMERTLDTSGFSDAVHEAVHRNLPGGEAMARLFSDAVREAVDRNLPEKQALAYAFREGVTSGIELALPSQLQLALAMREGVADALKDAAPGKEETLRVFYQAALSMLVEIAGTIREGNSE